MRPAEGGCGILCRNTTSVRNPDEKKTECYGKPKVNGRPSESLRQVRYETRGKLARRAAYEMQRMGYEIVSLDDTIGIQAAFVSGQPEAMT